MSNPQVKKVDPSETKAAFGEGARNAPTEIANVKDAVVQFTKVEDFTTFLAEYTLVDSNIVFHFFMSREVSQKDDKFQQSYLLDIFPNVLSPVAEAYFEATKPRVTAQYVPEMKSWWMRANGYATRLDPDGFVRRFLETLDGALDSSLVGRGISL